MTLDEAPLGLLVTVVASHAQTSSITRRLAELGIRAGAALQRQSRTSGGGAIVAIGDDRIAVSRSILRAVQVEPALQGADRHG